MPICTLHINMQSPIFDLSKAASEIFGYLRIKEYYEHDSANHVNETYFKGSRENFAISVSIQDEAGFENYPYTVVVQVNMKFADDFKGIVRSIVIDFLQNGSKVCRSVYDDPARNETQVTCILYSLKNIEQNKILEEQKQIITLD